MPTSKETAPVRGIAKNGPIVSTVTTISALANLGCTGKASASGLEARKRPMAIMPKSGMPTPVVQNPAAAGKKLTPADWPSAGGKIKLPAPKNEAKSIRPIGNISIKVSFCFIRSPSFQKLRLHFKAALIYFIVKLHQSISKR